MPAVLTTSSSITCPTSGAVQTSSQAKLKVSGAAVLTLSDIQGKAVSGCTVVDSSGPPPTKQCKTVVSATGTASKLTVGGVAVALETLQGSTDGLMPPPPTPPPPETPATPAISAKANQDKLKAI